MLVSLSRVYFSVITFEWEKCKRIKSGLLHGVTLRIFVPNYVLNRTVKLSDK